MSDTKYAPQIRSQKKNCKSILLTFTKSTDGDILDHLDKQPNRQGYVKALIRADIARNR